MLNCVKCVRTTRESKTLNIHAIMNAIFYLLISIPFTATAKNDNVTVLFVGDITFSGPVKYYVERNYHTYNDSFIDVAPYIRQADIAVANLESPFVGKDVYRYKFNGKLVTQEACQTAAPSLSFAGFDAVTLANNHMNDFGSRSANFTVEVLKKTGIKYFGVTYGKYNTSQKPLILEAKGIKIGFLGYCDTPSLFGKNCSEVRMLFNSGPAIYRDDIATRDVNKLKKAKVDIIVVLMHFGGELHRHPLPYQFHITKHLMSLGVQVIIGAHPHVLQPHCLQGDKVVAYSLGNFFSYPPRPNSGLFPKMYGARRLGIKPDKFRIDAFEHFVLGNSERVKMTRMFKVTLSRNGVLQAEYLPLKIAFDPKTKRLHPEPVKNAKWITVCEEEDKQCEKSCKNSDNERKTSA